MEDKKNAKERMKEYMHRKQLTKEDALDLYNSNEWKEWSSEKIVDFQLSQEILCMPFKVFHKAVEDVLNRPVWTHEFAFREKLIEEYFEIKEKPTLSEIFNLIPKEKKIALVMINKNNKIKLGMKEFITSMKERLKEKETIKGDSWKDTPYDWIKNKLFHKVGRWYYGHRNNSIKENDQEEKYLIDIANYSFLLYCKKKELEILDIFNTDNDDNNAFNCNYCDRELKPNEVIKGDNGDIECSYCGSQYLSIPLKFIRPIISKQIQGYYEED